MHVRVCKSIVHLGWKSVQFSVVSFINRVMVAVLLHCACISVGDAPVLNLRVHVCVGNHWSLSFAHPAARDAGSAPGLRVGAEGDKEDEEEEAAVDPSVETTLLACRVLAHLLQSPDGSGLF